MPEHAMALPGEPDDDAAPTSRPGAFGQAVRTVAWSFLGIRRSAGHAQDASRLHPVHVIVAGIVGAALFVALLVLLVHWVVGSAVAR